jgi:uncharacterized membrane protein
MRKRVWRMNVSWLIISLIVLFDYSRNLFLSAFGNSQVSSEYTESGFMQLVFGLILVMIIINLVIILWYKRTH